MKAIRSFALVSSDPKSMEMGAQQIYECLQQEINTRDLQDEVSVSMIGDVGAHGVAPFVIIYPEVVIYGPLTPDDVPAIVEEHLYKGRVAKDFLADEAQLTGLSWLMARQGAMPAQQRIVLERAGVIDPDDIESYIAAGGYEALGKVLAEMAPEDVIQMLKDAGLRGRGGAGFPTGLKWQFVAGAKGDKKYVICNADESEPGTFKDRLVLEGDPHSILEAMAIAGYAIGADEGYIYVRGEYRLAQERLQQAIRQATDLGLLGNGIFGSDFNFEIHLHSGAGAYICGEETALIESIEGKRGEPRSRPPYPTTDGLWGQPTLVNNVETLANVPPIMRQGAAWFKQFGTENSPGTKVYTILGNVNFTGLIEVPMGITLREVIAIYGRGMRDGSTLKLAQTGGSSGSLIPADLQDVPMDFDSFADYGVSLGSGALLICDQNTCVVDLGKVLLKFFIFESCGKCTPCRVGTRRVYEALDRISQGHGQAEDITYMETISQSLDVMANCGLGQAAAVPIGDMLKHFRAEVEAHINAKECPAGVCSVDSDAAGGL